MKGMTRVALMAGLVAMSATSVQAVEVRSDDDRYETAVYVVNNHLADVRVYAEDADGRLHNLGRVARGQLKNFDVPEHVAEGDFRIKIFSADPVWSPVSEDYGVKTNPLNTERDAEIRIWLEADLAQSIVEIDRG